MKHFAAPWSRSLIIISALATVICLGISAGAWWESALKHHPAPVRWVTLLPMLILSGAALFTIRGYTITSYAILVHRLLWSTSLPRAGLESARVEYLGRKGMLASVTAAVGKQMGQLAPNQRVLIGRLLNSVKQDLESRYETRKAGFERAALDARLSSEWIDLTLPAPGTRPGSMRRMRQLVDCALDWQPAPPPRPEQISFPLKDFTPWSA